jgi:hypothetical protein
MAQEVLSKKTNDQIYVDNFITGVDLNFWTLKRSEPGRVSPTKWQDKTAIKIDIKKGDKHQIDNRSVDTERNEISELPEVMLNEGMVSNYSFSFAFPNDFPVINNRLVFAQWKQKSDDDRSPFISFRYKNGNVIFQMTAQQNKISYYAEDKEWRGAWHSAYVKFKINKGRGFVRATVDDEELCDLKGIKLGFSRKTGKTYFKMGLYRDSVEDEQSIFLADFQRIIEK